MIGFWIFDLRFEIARVRLRAFAVVIKFKI